ncbi:hypothetical protein [Microbulbifer magnicolonia]|uniref:hypothetical protein n=1 Tax=Microbulbifer magnicolonia TaxID=3109744 RepID=UPI002B40690C|nr:hypothetical protein [Microbulbifer sp. GG15]
MSEEGIKAVFGAFGFICLLANIALTIELNNYPMKSRVKKFLFYLVVWLVPLIGAIWSHRKLKIGWAKGDGSSGHDTPVDPG